MDKILVIGANGQIGTELTVALRAKYGAANVIATDLQVGADLQLNVLDRNALGHVIAAHHVTQVYHLAAVLSAKGESDRQLAWDVNMQGLLNVLEVARQCKLRVFWPSSIAVFDAQANVNPSTVYGISKAAGEYWCQYYFDKYGLDVRSLRYPGLISHSAQAGGGTTDYAVEIFHAAVAGGHYECFLNERSTLPMMYMPDAVRATLELMAAPAITVRTSYNLAAMSFSPLELAAAIRRHLPDFTLTCSPDFRQAIANSWPTSVWDYKARRDWGWQEQYDLERMTEDMLTHLRC